MQNLKLNTVNRPLIDDTLVTATQLNKHQTTLYQHLLYQLTALGFQPKSVDYATISMHVDRVSCDIDLEFSDTGIQLHSTCSNHRHWNLVNPLEAYLHYHIMLMIHANELETKALKQSALRALPEHKQFWESYLNQDLSRIHYDPKRAHFIKLAHHHQPHEFWLRVLDDMETTQRLNH